MPNPDPKIKPWRDEKYLAHIRKKECLIVGQCFPDVVAHHVTLKGQGTMGGKPPDYQTVPLTVLSHQLQHAGKGVDRVTLLESIVDSMGGWLTKRLSEEELEWMLEDLIKAMAPYFTEGR